MNSWLLGGGTSPTDLAHTLVPTVQGFLFRQTTYATHEPCALDDRDLALDVHGLWLPSNDLLRCTVS